MNKENTYKAFTLIELLVSMVIALLVIAMAYLAFLFLTQRFVQQKNTSEQLTSVYRLKDLIAEDYSKAHYAVFESEDLFLSTAKSTIVYSTYSKQNLITRMLENRTDSFKVKNQGFQLLESSREDGVSKRILLLDFGAHKINIPIESKQSVMQQIRAKYED